MYRTHIQQCSIIPPQIGVKMILCQPTIFLLLISSFFVTVSCDMCNGTDTTISAPEVTLSELNSACDADHESRKRECVSAMNRYCSQVEFPEPINVLGVSRDSGDQRINLACIESSWKGDVSIRELMRMDSGCNGLMSQEMKCLSAIHSYCKVKLGENFAGISQGEGVEDGTLEVHCFESTRKEAVRHDVMRSFDGGCHYLTSHSDNCFHAASMFCSEYFQSDGGITVESDTNTITVACYRANYTGDAFIIRNNDFYASLSEVETVCDLDFEIENGFIAEESPQDLKSEVFDNRNSTVPLDSSFTVSTSVSESSTFTTSTQIAFTLTATFSFGSPMVLGGSIQLSTSITSTFTRSTTTSQTKTYTQSSSVSVPSGKMIMKQAMITMSTLDVPYTATVRTRLGTMKTIEGTWIGTSAHSFRIVQKDIDKIV